MYIILSINTLDKIKGTLSIVFLALCLSSFISLNIHIDTVHIQNTDEQLLKPIKIIDNKFLKIILNIDE